MKLRTKTLIILGVIFIGLLIIMATVIQPLLINSYLVVEDQSVDRNVQQAVNAFSREFDNLQKQTYDWATWDDTCTFVEDRNQGYIDSNLQDMALQGIGVNIMMFYNTSNDLVFGKAVDLQNGNETPIPLVLLQELTEHDWLNHTSGESVVQGLIVLPDAILLFNSRPIRASNEEGPIHGALLVGQYLTDEHIADMSRLIASPLLIARLDSALPKDFETARLSITKDKPTFIKPLNATSIAGYSFINDIFGNPVLILRIELARDTYQRGLSSLELMRTLWYLIIIIVCISIIVILEKLVISPLTKLDKKLIEISASKDISKRMLIKGNDELTTLAKTTNTMLEAIEKSQEKIQENEKRYRSLFENAHDMIQIFDPQGHFLYVNPAWKTAVGYSEDELSKLELNDILHLDSRPRCHDVFSKALAGATIEKIEAKLCTKDGGIVFVEGNASPHFQEGKIIGTQGIFRDVTSRKTMQDALEKSERKFRELTELLPQTVYEMDFTGKLTFVNNQALALFQYSRDEFEAGLSAFIMLVPEDVPRAKENFTRVLKGEHIAGSEYSMKRKDGTTLPVVLYSSPIIQNGRPVGLRGAIVDITELKKAYHDIEVLLKSKDDFINQLGHDLKTPLVPLINLLPSVREKTTDPKSIERLDLVLKSVYYMRELIVKTLDLARLNSPRFQLDMKMVNLFEETNKIIETNMFLWSVHQNSIENKIDPCLMVNADILRFQELMTNIFSNAVKHSSAGGKIIVDAKQQADDIMISVADAGIGMTPEQLTRMFDEFYKADQSRHQLDSSGLGLTISKRIVEKHGGRIWAESPGLGKGTTVFFTLPIPKTER
ncbi:MAG: PAS domain S-box protein [Euryarchaeota archaeon]|nr:PAS domain S-box protein [Euryarchaeota archaeon]